MNSLNNSFLKTVLLITLFLLLFCGANLLTYMGVDVKFFRSILIAVAIPLLFINLKYVIWNRPLLVILVVVSLFSILKLYTDTGEGTRMAVLQLLGATIIYASYPKINDRLTIHRVILWRKFFFLFIAFFLLVTGMAIIERIMGATILGWAENKIYLLSDYAASEFRSTSLLGHPLYNALVVTIMMAYILISPLKPKFKLLLWFVGYFAILCFNTRGSIVGNALLFGLYILYSVFFDKTQSRKTKKLLSIISITAAIVVLIVIFSTSLGGRLLEHGLMDDSAQVRVDVWNVFNYFELSDFFWGVTYNKLQMILAASGIYATENFWLDQLFSFGLVFMIAYVLMYATLIVKLLKNYTRFQALFVSGAFLLIASTNNSLSSDFLALFIFLMLTHLFDPKYIRLLIPRKYLIKPFKK